MVHLPRQAGWVQSAAATIRLSARSTACVPPDALIGHSPLHLSSSIMASLARALPSHVLYRFAAKLSSTGGRR